MLRNDSLNSKEGLSNSNIIASSKQLDQNEDLQDIENEELKDIENEELKEIENGIAGSSSINNIDDNMDNEEIHNSMQKIKSYASKQSSFSKSYSKSRSSSYTASEVSKSQSINKDSYLYEDEIVKKVNDQIKASIDHHPDYLSNYLYTNKSTIG